MSAELPRPPSEPQRPASEPLKLSDAARTPPSEASAEPLRLLSKPPVLLPSDGSVNVPWPPDIEPSAKRELSDKRPALFEPSDKRPALDLAPPGRISMMTTRPQERA